MPMFAFKEKIVSLGEYLPKQSAPVVDFLAVATGTLVIIMGVMQIVATPVVVPLSGLGSDITSEVIALQWAFLGLLLIVGGIAKTRVITVFAAEFLLLTSLAVIAILLWREPDSFAIATNTVIGALAFASAGSARLVENSEIKREISFARDHSREAKSDVKLPDEEIA